MIGLQARWSPAVRKIKQLVEAGEIGTIQSTTLVIFNRIPGVFAVV